MTYFLFSKGLYQKEILYTPNEKVKVKVKEKEKEKETLKPKDFGFLLNGDDEE